MLYTPIKPSKSPHNRTGSGSDSVHIYDLSERKRTVEDEDNQLNFETARFGESEFTEPEWQMNCDKNIVVIDISSTMFRCGFAGEE